MSPDPFYRVFEGEDWYPIDVDAGSSDKPLDLDYWTHLKNHEGDWTEAEASGATGCRTQVFVLQMPGNIVHAGTLKEIISAPSVAYPYTNFPFVTMHLNWLWRMLLNMV
ncbi:hypothetical protein B0H14DRAFT_3143118 [Mycena olivaceomarginata]|nr:hypothetical protein B0H14DRAFT_3143118 [Mycena olivaceomarginata]